METLRGQLTVAENKISELESQDMSSAPRRVQREDWVSVR
jgi:hypothetical protein